MSTKAKNKRIAARSVYLSAAVSCVLANAAFAQQSSTTPTKEEVEEVLVVGTRASLQSAIERKKNAGTVVDSIVAEDVAQFPDKNIGEALQRITGVQLQRDFGEGVAVSIRGIEPDLNRVEINGVSVLGNNGTGARASDFRELASELVKSIDVYKGFTADMTEGGIGGTVSITTRRPLEIEGTLFSATAAAEYLDTTDTTKPRGNLTFATKFFEDRLGVLLNVTYDEADTRGDFLRDTEWVRVADFDRSTEKTTTNPLYASYATITDCNSITAAAARTACQTQWWDYSPFITRYGIWERDDKRTSGQATIQYQVTENFDFFVEAEVNDRDRRLRDYNFSVDTQVLGRFDQSSIVTDAEHNVIAFNTAATAPTATTGAGTIFSVQNRDFSYDQRSEYYSAGFNWAVTDNIDATGLGVHSTATTDSQTNSIALNATIPSIRVQLDPGTGVPRFTFPTADNPQNFATYDVGPTIQYRPEEVETSEDQAKLDFDWRVDLPFFNMFEFGGQWRESQSLRYAGGGYTRPDGVVVPSANVTVTPTLGAADNLSNPLAPVWSVARLNQFVGAVTSQTPDTFFVTGVNREGLPDSWLTPQFAAIDPYFDLSGFNHDRVRVSNGYAQIPAHVIDETIYAAYLKANFATNVFSMPLTGNFGVRYIKTEDESSGSLLIRERRPTTTGGFTDVTVGSVFVAIEDEYEDILPSFNMSLQISPTVATRLGYAKVMARPKPTDLVPTANCLFDVTPDGRADADADDCTAGNPSLEPYRADQYDLDIAWYANRDTLVSGAVFYKDVKTFVLGRSLRRNVDLFGNGVPFDVTQPYNGAGAKIYGAEVSMQTAFTFLPAPFDGFGGIINYTYSDATDVGLTNSLTGEELPFPGLSEHSYNVIVYYDKGPLNARVAYNSRTDYLQAATERSGNPVFRDGSAYLDAKVTWRFNGDISAFAEAKNITGEIERTSSGSIRLGEMSYSGRRYFVGVSFKY